MVGLGFGSGLALPFPIKVCYCVPWFIHRDMILHSIRYWLNGIGVGIIVIGDKDIYNFTLQNVKKKITFENT